jgi:hypothetical protein
VTYIYSISIRYWYLTEERVLLLCRETSCGKSLGSNLEVSKYTSRIIDCDNAQEDNAIKECAVQHVSLFYGWV